MVDIDHTIIGVHGHQEQGAGFGSARALMAEPRVLLLDEPSSGMSEQEIIQLRGRLAALTGRGTALVLVEHNLNVVRSVCDSVTVLNLGHRICTGRTAEVLARQDVAEAFLGTAAASQGG
jgi:ABC-type branched-subunit amino acid transport system ATPase component